MIIFKIMLIATARLRLRLHQPLQLRSPPSRSLAQRSPPGRLLDRVHWSCFQVSATRTGRRLEVVWTRRKMRTMIFQLVHLDRIATACRARTFVPLKPLRLIPIAILIMALPCIKHRLVI
ncbi:unnamed protein product [Protopolystoma xenopodis]|uniref:Uncharacterized protein n=1 Tax=Protopolystoma xenopodis TaxID=117903 RepID=A0A448X5F6_9PLAT|nr:unnamed protein product [Protopolystoma xenopodis]